MNGEELKLQILYQDDRLLVVSKPAGLIVHRGLAYDDETVADIVRDRIIGAPVHAVHRLDRGTSGILLFALDSETARQLQVEFQENRVIKRYLALVRGPMRERRVVDHPVPKRKNCEKVPAQTEFVPLAQKDRWTLVEALPQTGRMHQIRRHAKHLSHPIIGDVKYGKGDINRFFREQYGLTRMALHSWRLHIRLANGNLLNLEAAIPDDLRLPLEKLGMDLSVLS